jgi:hypothetical protein
LVASTLPATFAHADLTGTSAVTTGLLILVDGPASASPDNDQRPALGAASAAGGHAQTMVDTSSRTAAWKFEDSINPRQRAHYVACSA